MSTTPTTKILAIGTINPGFDQSQVFAVLPDEVRETVDLYLDGKIEQWYSLQGKPGVAFIINVTDPAAAHEMLEKLPLGQKHMMSFELAPYWSAQPASLAARYATETLNVQSLLNVMRGANAQSHSDDSVLPPSLAFPAKAGIDFCHGHRLSPVKRD
jgi:hypothetical protein